MTTTTAADQTFLAWSGHSVQGSSACAVVKYHGPTNTRGSRWIATLKRSSQTGDQWRASATFEDGPLVAAELVLKRADLDWKVCSCHSIDPDTYCVGFTCR